MTTVTAEILFAVAFALLAFVVALVFQVVLVGEASAVEFVVVFVAVGV